MREKITYIADDGLEFADESACAEYEQRESFKTWYAAHPLYGSEVQIPNSDGASNAEVVPITNIATWFRKNRISLLEILRGMR